MGLSLPAERTAAAAHALHEPCLVAVSDAVEPPVHGDSFSVRLLDLYLLQPDNHVLLEARVGQAPLAELLSQLGRRVAT